MSNRTSSKRILPNRNLMVLAIRKESDGSAKLKGVLSLMVLLSSSLMVLSNMSNAFAMQKDILRFLSNKTWFCQKRSNCWMKSSGSVKVER